jgi:predicted GTPase
MMNDCILVGRPNVGKTLFALHFAEFLGMRNLDVTFQTSDGMLGCKHYRIDQAIRELSGMERHKTRELQTMSLQVPAGKSIRSVKFIDSCGLADGIHPELEIRKAMAQTLSVLRYAKIILHMIDASQFGRSKTPSDIDQHLSQYGSAKGHYAILANKMDLPSSKEGLHHIADAFPGQVIMPVSSLKKTGFKEVKALVCRYL